MTGGEAALVAGTGRAQSLAHKGRARPPRHTALHCTEVRAARIMNGNISLA